MKQIAAVVACAAVLAFAAPSFAELAKVGTPNGVAVVGTTGVNLATSGVNDANLGNIDLVTGLTITGGASGGTATVDFQLNNPVTGPRGETTFLLFATTATGATLTQLSIGTGVGGGFTNISTASNLGGGLALLGGGATNRFVGVYTGAIPTYTTFRAVFTIASGGSLAIDMVSNPEPGTWALFAFGLGGMGLLAWRRRTAAKLALAKAKS